MQRQLIVMRHAKSSWDQAGQSDHERPLNGRGRREAPMVGRVLATLGWIPDYVLSSDACRTRETLSHLQAEWDRTIPVEWHRRLYLAGYTTLREMLDSVPAEATTLLVLGHNPGWEEVVYELSGQPVVLKTAYAARLTSVGPTWSEAVDRRGVWQLLDIVHAGDHD